MSRRRNMEREEMIEWFRYHQMALISALSIIDRAQPRFHAQDWSRPENVCAWETFGIIMRRLCDCLRTKPSGNSAMSRKLIKTELVISFGNDIPRKFEFKSGPFDEGFDFFSQHFGHARLESSNSDFLRGIPEKFIFVARRLPDFLEGVIEHLE